MIENLIFDWSGTLADDFDATLVATNKTLLKLGGCEVNAETYRREFVLPVMGFYRPRLPGRTLAEIDSAFFAAMKTEYEVPRLFAGAERLLRGAKSRGQKLFILSTMSTACLERALTDLGIHGLFDGVYGDASDKGEVLPRLMQEHGLAADRTVFCGDTPHDMEVGHVAKVCLAASVYGYSAEDKMIAARPDFVMKSLADLSRALDRDYLIETQKIVVATVGGIVCDPEGKILLVRTKKWSNTFGIPGGKIDYGETMLEAYEREIKEETGLDLEESHFVMIQDCIESPEFVKPRHFLLINYISKTTNPEALVTNYEIEETRWVEPRDALMLPLNNPTTIVLKEAATMGFLDIEEIAS